MNVVPELMSIGFEIMAQDSEFPALIDDFAMLDIRVGRVIDAQPFPEGRYSTHILMIDFGPELGTKKSAARLAPNYEGPERSAGSNRRR